MLTTRDYVHIFIWLVFVMDDIAGLPVEMYTPATNALSLYHARSTASFPGERRINTAKVSTISHVRESGKELPRPPARWHSSSASTAICFALPSRFCGNSPSARASGQEETTGARVHKSIFRQPLVHVAFGGAQHLHGAIGTGGRPGEFLAKTRSYQCFAAASQYPDGCVPWGSRC